MDTSLIVAVALILVGFAVSIGVGKRPFGRGLQLFYVATALVLVVYGVVDRPHRYASFFFAFLGLANLYRRTHAAQS